jgi:hypothetical protein
LVTEIVGLRSTTSDMLTSSADQKAHSCYASGAVVQGSVDDGAPLNFDHARSR